MDKCPLVSVITPVYNSEKFIRETIESVIAQTFTNWELILVNDCSSDDSFSILKEFTKKEQRIKVLQTPSNQGAGAARNLAITEAKSDYIAFLDADDLWKPHKLETQIDFMQKHKVNVCFSSYQLMNEEGEHLPYLVEALPLLTYEKLLKSNYIGNLTGIYNCKNLGKIYGSEMRKRQDWTLWLRVLRKTGTAFSVTEPLAYYRIQKNSISNNKYALLVSNYEVYRKELGFGIIKSFFLMGRFLAEHFFVKRRQTKGLK